MKSKLDFLEAKLDSMEIMLCDFNVIEYFSVMILKVREQIRESRELLKTASKKSQIITLSNIEYAFACCFDIEEFTVDDIHRAMSFISLRLDDFKKASEKI